MALYPSFDPAWLIPVRMALDAMRDDPLWLERGDCPYEEPIKEALRGLQEAAKRPTGRAPREVPDAPSNPADDWETIRQESLALLSELQELRDSIEITDVKERLAITKTAAQLIERLIASGERAMNLRRYAQHQSTVLSVFDEILSPEQRTLAIEKLRQA